MGRRRRDSESDREREGRSFERVRGMRAALDDAIQSPARCRPPQQANSSAIATHTPPHFRLVSSAKKRAENNKNYAPRITFGAAKIRDSASSSPGSVMACWLCACCSCMCACMHASMQKNAIRTVTSLLDTDQSYEYTYQSSEFLIIIFFSPKIRCF